jgi:hypothetical protein
MPSHPQQLLPLLLLLLLLLSHCQQLQQVHIPAAANEGAVCGQQYRQGAGSRGHFSVGQHFISQLLTYHDNALGHAPPLKQRALNHNLLLCFCALEEHIKVSHGAEGVYSPASALLPSKGGSANVGGSRCGCGSPPGLGIGRAKLLMLL